MNKFLFLASIATLMIGCKKGNQQAGVQMGMEKEKTLPVITVTEQSTTSNLSFPVNIEGVVNSPVQAKISGYITKVLVDEGQAVRQGQPMFQLETQTLNQSAASAKAQIEVAQVEVNKLIPLVEKNIVSKVQLETAQANLQRAKAAYNEIASNIGFAVVKAPVSGVVGAISYREGALVTANNTVLTTVSDVKDVYAYFSMNEKDYLAYLAQTQGATVKEKIANFPEVSLILANGQTYNQKGKIQTVTGQIDHTTGAIQFRATFPNPDRLLTNGNSGTILIPQTFDKSLVIPEVATFEQQGKVFAYKVENGTIKQTVITLRSRANNLVVVNSGLKAGDVIIVQGLNGVRTGDKVTPQPVSMDSIVKAIQPIF
ncbi:MULTISPECIES: efflux RND transporter periplasmic adaptor subunit [unclassified Capnocytophaga]|uniref:efflux RND transporter periplasmic adaptor subunit n=1 Tax=unclassified Capnocytophaga TaxID=2640652 RepID=UPI000202D124|nr:MULTISPECIES: efflux RND transporter periplasmic adaptor subunit [unclassified Capnocytophaga]EGD35063.1 AcrA/AcrE family multidrug resistance protein [Capnocytophaga sp. oral taxon 338 str. F0234]MEB3003927.1 efflux RND transporter periplasmic adaptor subunit [Capnocytophaga sp. G2]